MQHDELARAPVLPHLPSSFGRGEPSPARMVGGVIVAMGTIDGGLAIDYMPRRSKQMMRVVLGIGESGMSIRHHGARQELTASATSPAGNRL